jgi:hypothetical protein
VISLYFSLFLYRDLCLADSLLTRENWRQQINFHYGSTTRGIIALAVGTLQLLECWILVLKSKGDSALDESG